MKKPNIIIILCDDLGYGDLGCYGNDLNATPRLDAMAEQGLRPKNFYAPAAYCLPSRLGLMTGVHPYREGIGIPMPALEGKYTMPRMLKEQGYNTALIGKWHLGLEGKTSHPVDAGYDYFYGTKGSNDWDGPGTNYPDFRDSVKEDWQTPLYNGKEQVGIIPQDEFTQRYTEQTVEFIKKNKEDSFFIYLAHNMPHAPLFPNQKFAGKSKGGKFGEVVEELDWSTGQIIDTLKEQGLAENTLIFFTSDNGPWTMFKEHGGTAKPLRGEKSTCWEGGGRVPAIAYWPGTIKPGESSEFMISTDLMKTFADMTRAKWNQEFPQDSMDASDLLFNNGKSNRQNWLFIHNEARSYISEDFKIHYASKDRTRHPLTGKKEPATYYDPPIMFNLVNDISETTDVANDYPEEYKRLQQEFTTAQANVLPQ